MYIEPAEGDRAYGHGFGYEEQEHDGEEHEGQAPRPGAALIETYPALGRPPSITIIAVLGACLLAVFWIGVYPSPLLETIDAASRAILP